MSKPMTRQEWLSYLEQTWDAAQKEAWSEQPRREWVGLTEEEPVAWGMRDMNGNIYDCISVQEHARIEGDYNVPLYTAPPHQEWVGLTDEEIAVICGECAASAHRADDISYARAIEAKLKEKNQ